MLPKLYKEWDLRNKEGSQEGGVFGFREKVYFDLTEIPKTKNSISLTSLSFIFPQILEKFHFCWQHFFPGVDVPVLEPH